jgi:hypothetical protein
LFRIHRLLNLTQFPDHSVFAEPANKLTTLTSPNFQKRLFQNASNDSPSLYWLDKNLATMHFSLFLRRSNPWNKVFFAKIDQLISAGIAQRLKPDVSTRKEEDPPARPLSMDHLGVCFIVVVICLALSCVVFAVEWLTKIVGDSMRQRF